MFIAALPDPTFATTDLSSLRTGIEEFLCTHPDVRDVQVISVPDDVHGKRLKGLACGDDRTAYCGSACSAYCGVQ